MSIDDTTDAAGSNWADHCIFHTQTVFTIEDTIDCSLLNGTLLR